MSENSGLNVHAFSRTDSAKTDGSCLRPSFLSQRSTNMARFQHHSQMHAMDSDYDENDDGLDHAMGEISLEVNSFTVAQSYASF